MAISTEYLHNRYMKANEALDKYGALIADRLSTGNTNPSQLQKFNLMSAWISFMSSKITVPSSITAASPKSISFPVPALGSGVQKFTIGVDSIEGEFTTIVAFESYDITLLQDNIDVSNFELGRDALIVKKGISSESTVDYLSVEDRELFNKILEDMAIELKISY